MLNRTRPANMVLEMISVPLSVSLSMVFFFFFRTYTERVDKRN